MKILGYEYTVSENSEPVDSDPWYGIFYAKSGRIQIRSDLCKQQKISSLLHEIIEALNYHLQLKLEHNVIMSLEAGLYQVLKDNGVDLKPLAKDILDG